MSTNNRILLLAAQGYAIVCTLITSFYNFDLIKEHPIKIIPYIIIIAVLGYYFRKNFKKLK